MQEVVRAVSAEDKGAQLKRVDEVLETSDGCQGTGECCQLCTEPCMETCTLTRSWRCAGAVDLLYYEIICEDLQHMRQTWTELRRPPKRPQVSVALVVVAPLGQALPQRGAAHLHKSLARWIRGREQSSQVL